MVTAIEKKLAKVFTTVKMTAEHEEFNFNTADYNYNRGRKANVVNFHDGTIEVPYTLDWAKANGLVKVEHTGKVYGRQILAKDGTYLCGSDAWHRLSFSAQSALRQAFGEITEKELRENHCSVNTESVKNIIEKLSAGIDALKIIME